VVEKKAGKMNVPVDNHDDNAPDASVVVAKRSPGVAVKRDGNINHRVDNGDENAQDATVVVGGKEFQEDSNFCATSAATFAGRSAEA
jgi:hypothetical protein